MSIFGDLEHFEPRKRKKPAPQMADLSLRPHVVVPGPDRNPPTPRLEALVDVRSATVSLQAEAKASLVGGAAATGVPIVFFVNGTRIGDVPADEFGIAKWNQPIPMSLFSMNPLRDELTVRVSGFAKEASLQVIAFDKWLDVRMSHQWKSSFGDRLRDLQVTVEAKPHRQSKSNLGLYLAGGFAVAHTVVSLNLSDDHWLLSESFGTGQLNDDGVCIIDSPGYYYDQMEYSQSCVTGGHNPCNLCRSWRQDSMIGVTITGYQPLGNCPRVWYFIHPAMRGSNQNMIFTQVRQP